MMSRASSSSVIPAKPKAILAHSFRALCRSIRRGICLQGSEFRWHSEKNSVIWTGRDRPLMKMRAVTECGLPLSSSTKSNSMPSKSGRRFIKLAQPSTPTTGVMPPFLLGNAWISFVNGLSPYSWATIQNAINSSSVAFDRMVALSVPRNFVGSMLYRLAIDWSRPGRCVVVSALDCVAVLSIGVCFFGSTPTIALRSGR